MFKGGKEVNGSQTAMCETIRGFVSFM